MVISDFEMVLEDIVVIHVFNVDLRLLSTQNFLLK